MVAEKKECGGSETNMGWKRTVADCADACRGKASMFTYGTNDFGTNKCLLPCRGCKCFCETASSSGTCNEELNHDGFRLYKYENNGSNCLFGTLISNSILLQNTLEIYLNHFRHNAIDKL